MTSRREDVRDAEWSPCPATSKTEGITQNEGSDEKQQSGCQKGS